VVFVNKSWATPKNGGATPHDPRPEHRAPDVVLGSIATVMLQPTSFDAPWLRHASTMQRLAQPGDITME
jgi:hypothetical protein